MTASEPFLYNPDFEWFESQVSVKGTPVHLFLSEEAGRPDLAVREQLGQLAAWTRQHADIVGNYCAGAIVRQETHFPPLPDLSLVSVWITPENYFELLFRVPGNREQFLVAGISQAYQVDYWKIVRK